MSTCQVHLLGDSVSVLLQSLDDVLLFVGEPCQVLLECLLDRVFVLVTTSSGSLLLLEESTAALSDLELNKTY